jgi:hypothetical protein
MLAAFALLGMTVDARTPATTAQPVTPQPAGLMLHIDPATGAIIDAPIAGASKLEIPASLSQSWSTSDAGLIEQPNPSGGKGVYVNLQGRFENGSVATIDADGALNAPCAQGLSHSAAAAEKK